MGGSNWPISYLEKLQASLDQYQKTNRKLVRITTSFLFFFAFTFIITISATSVVLSWVLDDADPQHEGSLVLQ